MIKLIQNFSKSLPPRHESPQILVEIFYRESAKKFLLLSLEASSYLWYILGVLYFVIYSFKTYKEGSFWSNANLMNVVTPNPEIQIAALFLFMALSSQLVISFLQEINFQGGKTFQLRKAIFYIFLLFFSLFIFWVHFFIYINVDRYIPKEAFLNQNSGPINRFSMLKGLSPLFDGDDGTFYSHRTEIKIPFEKNAFSQERPPFKWIWICFAKHTENGLKSVSVNFGNKKIKASMDFSIAYLRVDLPDIKEIPFISITTEPKFRAKISELYFVGRNFWKFSISYFALLVLSIYLVSLKSSFSKKTESLPHE